MTASAADWAWANSRASNGSLLVLMAIAFEADEKGECVMSVAELARKARLSDRAVQNATPVLVTLGELAVDVRVADSNRNRYRLLSLDHGRTGADSAPVQNLRGAESAPVPNVIHRPEPVLKTAKQQARAVKGADSAPVAPVDNFSDDLDLGSVVSGGKSRSKSSSEPVREDVERLCQHLASRIEANGCKRPAIGKRWRDAARLLIDNDGRTEQQVMAAIDWCQQNEFWRANIMSMPKLREKYDTLRLQAQQEQRRKAHPPRQQETDDQFKRAMERIKARKENANGAGGDSGDRPLRQVALPPAGD